MVFSFFLFCTKTFFERKRADKAEARAEAADRERRELQGLLTDATKAVVLLQGQLTALPDGGHVVDETAELPRPDGKGSRRRWLFGR